tara:strand:+ start:166 stop:948 length:783 start_codon:yes stop_codon:yes gene_type:complete
MVFAAELDDVRQQIRQGGNAASNQVVFWPSVAGTGNVAVSGTPTYEIRKDSTAAIATGDATATTVDGVSKLSIGIDATDTAVFELKENYSVLLTWVYSGMTHVSTVRFDCVLDPVGDLNVTLNDLIEEVVDMDERLTRQATIQGTGRTAEQAASIYAVKAWGDVYRWIKSKSDAQGGIVPRLIVDREALRRVVVARACARVFRAEGGGLDSESRQLFEDFSDEAVARFGEMGPLAYDASETGVADSTVSGWSVVQMRRTW